MQATRAGHKGAALYSPFLYTLSESKTPHGQWDSGQRITVGGAVSPGGGWSRKSVTNQADGGWDIGPFLGWAGQGWAGLGCVFAVRVRV